MTRICYWEGGGVMISLLLIIIGYQSGNIGYARPIGGQLGKHSYINTYVKVKRKAEI